MVVLCQGFGQAQRPVPTVAAKVFLNTPPVGSTTRAFARSCSSRRIRALAQNTPRPAPRETTGFTGRERGGASGERGLSKIMRLRRRRVQAISGPAPRVVTEREETMRRSGSPVIPGAPRERTGASLRPPREFLKNSINIDKFTGFFDKFLKIYLFANDCNIKGLPQYPSAGHSDPAPKKVFRLSRISPHLPALAPVGPGPFFYKCLLIRRLPCLYGACGAQAGDFLRVVADLGEDLLGVLAQHR